MRKSENMLTKQGIYIIHTRAKLGPVIEMATQEQKYETMWKKLKSETEGIEGTTTVPVCWVHARMKCLESEWESDAE